MAEEIEGTRRSWFVYAAAIVVNLQSFGAGIAYGWSSPSIPKLNGNVDPENNPLERPTTLTEDSWIASLLSLGALVGPHVAGTLADKIGRKKTLLYFSIPMIMSFFIMIFASTVIEFYVARFLIGVSVGACFSVTPMYLAEISTKKNRGMLGLTFSLNAVIGQLLTCIIAPYVSIKIFSIMALFPCFLFLILFGLLIPETPYYYLLVENEKDAEYSLKKINGGTYSTKEFSEIIQNVKESKLLGKAGLIDLFRNKIAVKGLIICFGLMFVRAACGILPVLSYLQDICSSTGSLIPEEICLIIVSVAQLITVLIVFKIIDNVRRKVLLLLSVIGCVISVVVLGTYFYLQNNNVDMSSVFWLPLVTLVSFFIFFTVGLGPICWNITGEIFATKVRAISNTMVTLSNFGFGFLTTIIFPGMSQLLGMPGTLWIFAGITCLFIPFIIFVVPETKGMSLMEIQNILTKNVDHDLNLSDLSGGIEGNVKT